MVEEDSPLLGETPRKTSNVLRTILVTLCTLGIAAVGIGKFGRTDTHASSSLATTPTTGSERTLLITINREGYPAVSQEARHLYGWDLIGEPYVTNILSVDNPPSKDPESYTYVWTMTLLEGPAQSTWTGDKVWQESDGSITTVDHMATQRFSLAVQELDSTGKETRYYYSETLIFKYVRREIRGISDDHRNAYLDALHTMYTISQEEGEAKYGSNFIAHAHLSALHDASDYSYHGNPFFLTAHPAFILKVEKSLLAIDPNIVLPYWDFMIDAEAGGDWAASPIYKEDWFGSVDNGPEDDFRIRGRFRDVKVIYDKTEEKFPRARHGPFGFLNSGYSRSEYLQRSSYNCGFYHEQGFSPCTNLEKCLNRFASGELKGIFEYDVCLEDEVHGTLHGMHGGLWDCPVDFNDFLDENSEWLDHGLLSFMAVNSVVCQWQLQDEWLDCDSSCGGDHDDATCGCKPSEKETGITKVSDIDHLDDGTVDDLLGTCLEDFYKIEFRGKVYMEEVDGKYKWRGLTDEQNGQMNRLLLKTASYADKYSTFLSGASTNDPLFFIMHQVFDRASHLARLDPEYNKADWTWSHLRGSDGEGWLSVTPFSSKLFEPFLGDHMMNKNGKPEYMTNKQIWSALKPDGVATPYVYDSLRTFGSCTLMGNQTSSR